MARHHRFQVAIRITDVEIIPGVKAIERIVKIPLNDHRPPPDSLDFLRGEHSEEQIDILEVEFGQYALDELFIGQILADGLFVIRSKSTGSDEFVSYLLTNVHSYKCNTFLSNHALTVA